MVEYFIYFIRVVALSLQLSIFDFPSSLVRSSAPKLTPWDATISAKIRTRFTLCLLLFRNGNLVLSILWLA